MLWSGGDPRISTICLARSRLSLVVTLRVWVAPIVLATCSRPSSRSESWEGGEGRGGEGRGGEGRGGEGRGGEGRGGRGGEGGEGRKGEGRGGEGRGRGGEGGGDGKGEGRGGRREEAMYVNPYKSHKPDLLFV